MSKSKKPRTFRHLANQDAPQRLVQGPPENPPDGRGWSQRLQWTIAEFPYDADNLAGIIGHPNNKDVNWICDTNLFIAETDNILWDRLLEQKDRLLLTAPVYRELAQWLTSPENNLPVSDVVKHAVEIPEEANICLMDFPDEGAVTKAAEYYVNLLGLRKNAHSIAESRLVEKLGRKPTKKEISDHTVKELGIRGQLVADKATKGAKEHRFNDEEIVMLAIFHAIVNGAETSILTYDADLLEHFYKALWLIDTHYRSMLFADLYAKDPLAFQPTQRLQGEECFSGEVLLVPKPSADLKDILPKEYRPVSLHCHFINKSHGTRTSFSFCAEREISRLFSMKIMTGGRNTDRFGGANCHIAPPGGLKHAAIAHDREFAHSSSDYRISMMDANLSVMSSEGYFRSVVVDPNRIILPQGY